MLWTFFAAAALAAAPAPDEFMVVPCPFFPTFFEPGSDELTANRARILDSSYYESFELYRPGSDTRILIGGDSSDGQSAGENAALTQRRIERVRRHFLSRGIVPDRIRIGLPADFPTELLEGRGVMALLEMRRSELLRLMPPGGPIC